MNVVNFSSVRADIINSFKRRMLIPIIGSGFTCGCASLRGMVPSGDDYREYMISSIEKHQSMTAEDKEYLKLEPFSGVSSAYHEIVPQQARLNYLRDNFTRVTLEEYKTRFLSIDWPYIYTLNIDDGVEHNSAYNTVVYSNRSVQNSIFDENKCVIKLHGDISEILTYDDAVSEIFDQKQYVMSLQTNVSLLSRLTHDYQYQNLLYIGCSLSDEIDILSASNITYSIGTARYFCTVRIPSYFEQMKLKKYGITHCIVFESYEDIYESVCDAAKEAGKIGLSDIDCYKSFSFKKIDSEFEHNKAYLFYGKSMINRDRTISVPYFFISRNVTAGILANINSHAMQFVWGSGCSGKTYIAIDIVLRTRDRDVFVFESKDSLSDTALDMLIDRGNCLLVADNGSLTINQIEYLIKADARLLSKHVHVIVISNKNNRDISGLIRLMEMNSIISQNYFPETQISNRFSTAEIEQLNPLLVEATLGVFSPDKTIIDNIIEASAKLLEKNRFSNITPHYGNARMLASLVALAIEQKVYSSRMIDYDIANELYSQQHATEPLIEQENTWEFETSASNNSAFKYVINAEYWLNNQLDIFAKRHQNHDVIVAAFRHIITRIVLIHGKPDLMHGEKYSQYKPYILFDNINKIFRSQGLQLARSIYANLNDLLSNDPNYMHQRAKCYIKSAKQEKQQDEKIRFLEKAYRDASVACSSFKQRFEESKNDKIQISIAHVEYTMALALCHLCKLERYTQSATNTMALTLLHGALKSPYNSYDFIKSDSYNYGNAVSNLITTLISDKTLIAEQACPLLEEVVKIIMM